MKKTLIALAVSLAATVPAAYSATIYTYSTSGCFSGASVPLGAGTASAACTGAGSTLTYTDPAPASELFTYTDGAGSHTGFGTIDLGTISVSTTGSEPAPGAVISSSFSLTVTFSTPPGTNGNPFQAILSGNMNGSFGGATLTFNPETIYFSDGNPADSFGLTISPNPVQVSTANTPVTVTATLGAVPEPFSMGLIGGGLALLGAARWRRKATKA